MTPPAEPRLEERILTALGFIRWPWRPASRAQIAVILLAGLALVVGPTWLRILVAAVVLTSAATYWTAFVVKVVREFRAGYRGTA